jgi:hypothetical protein
LVALVVTLPLLEVLELGTAVAEVAEVVMPVLMALLVETDQAESSSLRSSCKDETLGFN